MKSWIVKAIAFVGAAGAGVLAVAFPPSAPFAWPAAFGLFGYGLRTSGDMSQQDAHQLAVNVAAATAQAVVAQAGKGASPTATGAAVAQAVGQVLAGQGAPK